jgi:hypothetical protein
LFIFDLSHEDSLQVDLAYSKIEQVDDLRVHHMPKGSLTTLRELQERHHNNAIAARSKKRNISQADEFSQLTFDSGGSQQSASGSSQQTSAIESQPLPDDIEIGLNSTKSKSKEKKLKKMKKIK